MPIVNAYGKRINFPDDMSHEEIASVISANEKDLNPDYKAPESGGVRSFIENNILGFSTKEKPSIADQAEATADEGANTAAPQIKGAPVRQSFYNKALLDNTIGVPITERFRKPDREGVMARIRNAADEDIKGQAQQREIEGLRTDGVVPEGGFVALAKSGVGQSIKAAGQLGSDYFGADKDNALIKYGDEIIRENPGVIKTLQDIKDQPFMAFKEASGNMVPSFGAMLGTAVLGQGIISVAPLTGPLAPVVAAVGAGVKWLGPAAIAALPSYGSIRDKQIFNDKANEDSEKAKAIALLGASAVGAIEVAFGPQNWAISMLTKEGRAALARKFAATTPWDAFMKGGLLGGVSEAGEEIVQTPIEQLSSFENPLTKKNIEETKFGGAMAFIGGFAPGGITNTANYISQQAQIKADRINAERAKLGLDKIVKSTTVDEAINAANESVSQKPVDKDDVLRVADPTLADIERLTGLKPSESIQEAERQQSILSQAQQENNATQSDIEGQNNRKPKTPRDTEIVLPDNKTLNAQWDIVDADNVKASLKNGESQPRDRTRAASDLQIQSIAKNPDYRRLSDSPVMDIGAPVLSNDGQIVGGNGRFEAISRAYDQDTAQEYIDNLRQDAIRKGIDPAVIDQMKKPVLVRRITQPFDTRQLAIASNSGMSAQYSDLEQSKIDSERLKGLEDIITTDNGDIALTADNIRRVRDALGNYSPAEVAPFVDANGQLSQQGMKRIRNAMLAKAYGDNQVIQGLIESNDSDIRNILGALTRVVGDAVKSQSTAPKESNVTPSILEAVNIYNQLKQKNQPVSNYLKQQDAFSGNVSPAVENILMFLDKNARSQPKLTEFFRDAYTKLGSIDTKTADIFGEEVKPKPEDLFEKPKELLQPSATLKKDSSWIIKNKKTGEVLFETFDKDKVDNLNTNKYEAIPAIKYLQGINDDIKGDTVAKELQDHLKKNGYEFYVKPVTEREFNALSESKKAQKELAEKQAKIFGKKVVFVKTKGNFGINGVMVPAIKDTIFIDLNTPKPFHAVMAHELSHWMEQENPKAYKDMLAALNNIIVNEDGYRRKYNIDDQTKGLIPREIAGDLMGDNFTKPEFWQKVAEYNPSKFKEIAQNIIKWLKNIILKAKARGMGSEEWVTDAKKAQDIIAKAVSKYTKERDAEGNDVKFHRAYHGSPHDHNKFDSSKIGTGEGAQAYGYGHYFADSKDVAEYYKKVLSVTKQLSEGQFNSDGTPNRVYQAAYQMDAGVDNDSIEEGLMVLGLSKEDAHSVIVDAQKLFTKLEKESGKLYEVELAPKQDEYLLWDKPLSEQSEKVKKALGGQLESLNTKTKRIGSMLYASVNGKIGSEIPGGMNGQGVYSVFKMEFGSDKKASEYLHSLGIRGIKYLDGSSRAKGEGAYNYVIFDDKDIEIKAKFSKQEQEKTLLAHHNLTAANLIHADKMGGLIAPSIAISNKNNPLSGFGDITLIADKDIVDPKKGAKVFGSDIYSPRYPEITYVFDKKSLKSLNDSISEGKKAVDEHDIYESTISSRELKDFSNNPAVVYQFLKENNIKPDIKLYGDFNINDKLKQFANTNMDAFDLSKDNDFKNTVKEIFDGNDEKGYVSRAYANDVIKYREHQNKKGKVNREDARYSLTEQVRKNNLSDDLEKYAIGLIQSANPKEKIFQGYTNSGNRKYIDHSIDNVLRLLKKELRGGENFNYGLGSVRSKYSPQFKSIADIKENEYRLMSSEKFNIEKEKIKNDFSNLDSKFSEYATFSGFDNFSNALMDVPKLGISRALKENGFENVPDKLKLEVEKFINQLRNMPTEYFEAKQLKSMPISDFSAAVIPDNAPKKINEILSKNGITDIREYKSGDKNDRVEKIKQFEKLMFSRQEDTNNKEVQLNKGEKLWLRYGDIPDSQKSKHVQHGFEENGVSVVAPLDDLGNTSWSMQMIFSMTAGEMAKRDLYVVAGKQLKHNPHVYGESGYGSDGEPLIENARVIRKATQQERYLLVKDMENVATREFGMSKIPNLYKLLKSEKPDSLDINDNIKKKSAIGNNGEFSGSNNDIRFSFAGENSETANKYQLSAAQQRLDAGENANTVREETGWFKGADGKWRYEINDRDAKLGDWFVRDLDNGKTELRNKLLPGVLWHDRLYAAYPALREIRVDWDKSNRVYGKFDANENKITIKAATAREIKSVLLHEIQHGIQKIEGFAAGGSPDKTGMLGPENSIKALETKRKIDIAHAINREKAESYLLSKNKEINDFVDFAYKKWTKRLGEKTEKNPYGVDKLKAVEFEIAERDEALESLLKLYNKQVYLSSLSPLEIYRRLYGEIESRNVQSRINMDDEERRLMPPYTTQDIPDRDAIVMFNGNVMENAPAPENAKPFNPNEDIPETKAQKAQRIWQDKFNRFRVIKEWLAKEKGINLSEAADVYGAEERYYGKVANQQEDFREKVRNPLIEKISKAGYKLDDVEQYLLNRHAQEANAQNRKLTGKEDSTAYGISDANAQAYLDKAPKELAKLADEVQALTDKTQQLRLDNGIETDERVNAMKGAYQYYVPVRGDAESQQKQNQYKGTGKGFSMKYKPRRRLGHELRNESVIENIFQDYERAIIQVEDNRVGKSLALMAAEIQMPELISIDQPVKRKVLQNQKAYGVLVKGELQDVFQTEEAAKQNRQLLVATDKKLTLSDITIAPITDQRLIYSASPMLADNEVLVYMNGHEIRLQINDELLARAYKNMGTEALGNILSTGRAINGWMSKAYTGYNPEFILTNIQRDFQSGIINLTGEQGILIAGKAVANYPKSFASLLKYAFNGKSDKWIDAYRDNGGNTGAAYLPDLERLGEEVKREYASYQGVIANLKEGDSANALRAAGRKAFNATLKYINHLNAAGENAFRLATFKAMVESGKSVNEAASMAKNVTVNFNRKGEMGAELNALYLFFNASLQGTAATSHALFKGRHKFQAWGLSGAMMSVGYMMASMLGGFDDEDKYDEISDATKSRNLIMSYGDGYVKIPVPYGYGFFYNAGRMLAEAQRKGEIGKMPYQLMALATEEFSPFNVASTEDSEFSSKKVYYGFLPTMLKIPAEITNNYSSFANRELYPEKTWYQSEPDNEKMWRETKGTVYDISAQYLASIGIEISPEVLKYMTRTATGGSGAFVDSAVSGAILKSQGAELEAREIPFARKFYGENTIQDARARYGKAKEEARIAFEKFNALKKKNDIESVRKFVDDKKELLALNSYANKLSDVIKNIRDQQDLIKLSDKYTTAEKRLKIKELENQEKKYYDMFMKQYKTVKH